MSYRILRNIRTRTGSRDVVVATNRETYAIADQERNVLQEAERKAKPRETSWTYDIFVVELEKETSFDPAPRDVYSPHSTHSLKPL